MLSIRLRTVCPTWRFATHLMQAGTSHISQWASHLCFGWVEHWGNSSCTVRSEKGTMLWDLDGRSLTCLLMHSLHRPIWQLLQNCWTDFSQRSQVMASWAQVTAVAIILFVRFRLRSRHSLLFLNCQIFSLRFLFKCHFCKDLSCRSYIERNIAFMFKSYGFYNKISLQAVSWKKITDLCRVNRLSLTFQNLEKLI